MIDVKKPEKYTHCNSCVSTKVEDLIEIIITPDGNGSTSITLCKSCIEYLIMKLREQELEI